LETYSHAFYTWALAKHGVKAGRAAGISGAIGGSFPDIPAFVATAYYVGPTFASEGWSAMDEEMLQNIYFTGPFGGTGSTLHSAVPVVALLGLYFAFKMGRRDGRSILLWFLLGWFGHTVADFLTHVDDTRPLFWPISNWEWSSPISYYNSAYYGTEFQLVNNSLMLFLIVLLLALRIRRRFKAKNGNQ
jgi:hypothetical protein